MATAGRSRGKLMGFYFIRAREAAAPLFFFANPVAANAGAARSYGVDANASPPPRRADGLMEQFV
ncbi:hypothetical protein [Bradyrhizobium sp.]|jgi:hypothetical protein|uniref:hypothetical protein n=1 Tax=Bradyrhizobium sp. TaxID=376 RepID=UPI003C55770B